MRREIYEGQTRKLFVCHFYFYQNNVPRIFFSQISYVAFTMHNHFSTEAFMQWNNHRRKKEQQRILTWVAAQAAADPMDLVTQIDETGGVTVLMKVVFNVCMYISM